MTLKPTKAVQSIVIISVVTLAFAFGRAKGNSDDASTSDLLIMIEVLKKDYVEAMMKIKALEEQDARIHERISGIKLSVAASGPGDSFACGQEHGMGGTWVMSGSRDGTSCGVRNVNYYKQMIVEVPAKAP